MINKFNSIKLKKLLWINIIILLFSCQSPNTISSIGINNVEPDNNQLSKKDFISSINKITGKIANLYEKKSLADYIGDTDKERIAIATMNAANTNEPQLFTNKESGIKGKAEVIKSRQLPTLETGEKESIRECKTIRQTIILKDKREIIESIELCKGLNGWR